MISAVAGPCYPSDALALARQTNIPIYVSADVLAHVKPFRSPAPAPDERDELLRRLERIRPEYFSPSSPGDRLTAE